MSAKNHFACIGNLGGDAETKFTQKGTAIATFSLPVVSGYGDNQKTSWMRCSIIGKRAEGGVVPYLKKGTQVAVIGEISLNTWTGKDGAEKTSLELKVDDISLVGGKSSEHREPASPGYAKKADPFADSPDFGDVPVDDDIPF